MKNNGVGTFDNLSSTTRAKLDAVFADYETGGQKSVNKALERLRKTDFPAYAIIVMCVLTDKEFREAFERVLIARGQTDAEFLAEMRAVQVKH